MTDNPFVNKIVAHPKFGEGTVTDLNDDYISVLFASGEKVFPFPKAFDVFLKTDDSDLFHEAERRKKIEWEKKIRQEEQEKLEEQKKQEEKARAEELAKAAAAARINHVSKDKHITRSHDIEGSNVAFKCTFCDGGSSEDCVGFKEICSDACMQYNIERAKHVWCSTDSPCRKYYDRVITRKELNESFSCYESSMLIEWKCMAGVIQNGYDSGRPMKLLHVKENKLAVLTTRDPETADRDRYIFAVFLIDEYYDGDEKQEGFVQCHSKWKIELKPTEARQMLFWNYYANPNAPTRMVFGSGLHRYLSDIKAAQILKDIIRVKTDEKDKVFAKEFFEYYCTLTKLDKESIPEPRGALRLY